MRRARGGRGGAFLALLGFVAVPAISAAGGLSDTVAAEVKSGIDVGLRYLRFEQGADGSWGGEVTTTALVLRALADSHRGYHEDDGPFMRDGYDFLARWIAALADAGTGSQATLGELAAASRAVDRATRPGGRAAAEQGRKRLATALARPPAAGSALPAVNDLALTVEVVVGLGMSGDERLALGLASRIDGQLGAVAGPALDDVAALVMMAAPAGLCRLGEEEVDEAIARAWRRAISGDLPSPDLFFLARSLADRDPAETAELVTGQSAWRDLLARRILTAQRAQGDWLDVATSEEPSSSLAATAWSVLALEALAAG